MLFGLVKMTYFHCFFQTIDGALGDLSLLLDIFEFYRSQSFRDLSLISRAQCVGEWRGQFVLVRVPEEETCGWLLKNTSLLQHLNFQFISSFYISSSARLLLSLIQFRPTSLVAWWKAMLGKMQTYGNMRCFHIYGGKSAKFFSLLNYRLWWV